MVSLLLIAIAGLFYLMIHKVIVLKNSGRRKGNIILNPSLQLSYADQGLKWIVETESKHQVQQIRYDDAYYLKHLKHSISNGHVVVLVKVKDKLNPELGIIFFPQLSVFRKCHLFSFLSYNLLEKPVFSSNENTVIEIGAELVDCWSPKFRLYLITKEENYPSNLELASKVIEFPVSFIITQLNSRLRLVSAYHSEFQIKPCRIRGQIPKPFLVK